MSTFAPAANDPAATPRAPRISPLHEALDRRHSDLSFSIDTGGRPCFRVLVASDRSLFLPENAGARNASNFYDSQSEGLLPFDGAPCFYLLPRSVLHGLMPASRLYYTLVAYEDSGGSSAAYAHEPEALPQEAPSVGVSSRELGNSLSTMFGTPASQLLRVTGTGSAWGQAAEEVGEDVEGEDGPVGLSADNGEADDEDMASGEAAAADAAAAEAAAAEAGDGADDLYGEDAAEAAGARDWGDDSGEQADDGPEAEAQAAGDDVMRTPVLEGQEAAAFGGDGEDSEGGDASGNDGWQDEAAGYETPAGQSLADDYDDGYGPPATAAAAPPPLAYEEQAEDHYGAEHDEHGEDGGQAAAYGAPAQEPVPEMLPDEDADAMRASSSSGHDDDEVEIEAPEDAQALDAAPGEHRRPLDIEVCKKILALIMPFESGSEGFSRVVEDGEFAGRFGTAHPAYQRWHLGLTFGAFSFVQELGTLGQLLSLMRDRDRAAFDQLFEQADELIEVTTSSAEPKAWESPDGFSPRLRPVGGKHLWQEPWVGRFRRAGLQPRFQGPQNELAARLYIQPVQDFCKQVGLDSEQAFTLVVDRAVQMGATAALGWVLEAVTPVDTPAVRQQALARLSGGDLSAFQSAHQLPVTGAWDVPTHAAVIGALRALPDSPVPVLGCAEMVDAMLRHAQGLPWAERMKRLRDAVPSDRFLQL
jgi:hypothetical protein